MTEPLAAKPNKTWVGTMLRDGWRIDAKIADGGIGSVFRVTNARGERAAVKLLHPEVAIDEDIRKRFLTEGQVANAVGHPGVVRVLATEEGASGAAYIVMELLEGELLEERRLRAGGRLGLTETCALIDQLLDVLEAAHARAIVHRDIKPANLFLLKDGTLKVLDFGIAQMKLACREQTATGFLLGTPEYMAPEQAQGNRALIDAQTDVWAVGATMFRLLSGEPVHIATTIAGLLAAAAAKAARSLGEVAPDVPPPIVAVVDRALELDKSLRFASARAMRSALRMAMNSVMMSTSPGGDPDGDTEGHTIARPPLFDTAPPTGMDPFGTIPEPWRPSSTPPPDGEDDDSATVALPRDAFGLGRRPGASPEGRAQKWPSGGPQTLRSDDRIPPSSVGLKRTREGQVVVGSGAVGDEPTVAAGTAGELDAMLVAGVLGQSGSAPAAPRAVVTTERMVGGPARPAPLLTTQPMWQPPGGGLAPGQLGLPPMRPPSGSHVGERGPVPQGWPDAGKRDASARDVSARGLDAKEFAPVLADVGPKFGTTLEGTEVPKSTAGPMRLESEATGTGIGKIATTGSPTRTAALTAVLVVALLVCLAGVAWLGLWLLHGGRF